MPVKVTPRARRDEIVGTMADGTIKVRVTASPAGGAANRAVQLVLARALGIKPLNVEIVRGKTSHRKLLRVIGMKNAEVNARLGLPV